MLQVDPRLIGRCSGAPSRWATLQSLLLRLESLTQNFSPRQVAHNLGLSHLSIEKPEGMPAEEVRRYHGQRWRLAADREIGRRVWYTLVDLDWSTCPEHHFTYITPASLHNAEEPANIDDDDLEGSGPVKGRPKDVHTVGCLNGSWPHLSRADT